jgi:hypothetical protein
MHVWVSFDEFLKLLREAKDWYWGVCWSLDGLVLKIRDAEGITRYSSPNPYEYGAFEFDLFVVQVIDLMKSRSTRDRQLSMPHY